jgi:hypothetical protein
MRRILGLLWPVVLASAACEKPGASVDAGPGVGVGAGVDAGPAASGRSADAGPDAGEEVRSVYPDLEGAPDPIASRLCAAIHDAPEARRAECCHEPKGLVMVDECKRMLTAALRAKAVTVVDADIEVCTAALAQTYAGCAWVGPFRPELPASCVGIVKGTLGLGQKCRSALECAGKARCKGVGPTTVGTCAAAGADGESCGGTVDPLATFVLATDVEKDHPSCTGYCARFKCATQAPKDGACTQSRDCAAGLQCIGKKCVDKPAGKAGEACPGAVCEVGLSCVQGKCVAPREEGQVCTTDFECRGGCIKAADAGVGTKAPGKCGTKCGVR